MEQFGNCPAADEMQWGNTKERPLTKQVNAGISRGKLDMIAISKERCDISH